MIQSSHVWFNRQQIMPYCPEQLDSIDPMAEELRKLIEDEVKGGIPINRIVIGEIYETTSKYRLTAQMQRN